MRFLCLHGLGTNSQTAALRYELGDSHTYEFVDGTIPTSMAPEFANVASPNDDFFAYANFDDLASCLTALDQLDAYVAAEGPFDGLLAFSQGATIAATYLAHMHRTGRRPPFKCAVFFSAGGVFDFDLLASGKVKLLTPEDVGEIITIPTAHIWGLQDNTPVQSAAVGAVCAGEKRQVFLHEGGHEIPGVRSPADVKGSVRVMRRVISMAA
ncbi:family of serine hydrolases 3 [Achaetomium macrosporum]|uniref:Family of serine hydrolases 3 n=1 Tax=Achaetomium macrosporum TaxID=79813 RepID=A0AAN7H9J0_9PEZI|nr:family of serine hydrolases 3 [Achaetomium macrosporum]